VSHHHPTVGPVLLSLLLVGSAPRHDARLQVESHRSDFLSPWTVCGPTVEAQNSDAACVFHARTAEHSGDAQSRQAPTIACSWSYNTLSPDLYVKGLAAKMDWNSSRLPFVTTVKNLHRLQRTFHNWDFIVGGSEPAKVTVGLLVEHLAALSRIHYLGARLGAFSDQGKNCKQVDLVIGQNRASL